MNLEAFQLSRALHVADGSVGFNVHYKGERGNIVLSCVSVFTANSLINYSAGPSDCDLQF